MAIVQLKVCQRFVMRGELFEKGKRRKVSDSLARMLPEEYFDVLEWDSPQSAEKAEGKGTRIKVLRKDAKETAGAASAGGHRDADPGTEGAVAV